MRVQAEDANWLGNLINWLIFQVIGGFLVIFGLLFVLFGTPDWWYETVTGLELLPPAATFYTNQFDAEPLGF